MISLKHLIVASFILFLLNISTYAQNQAKADSLKTLYKSGNYEGSEIDILTDISYNETNPDISLRYSQIVIDKATAAKDNKYLISGLAQQANSYQRKGDPIKAIDSYYKALELAQKENNEKMVAGLMISIADTYAVMGNEEKFEKFYEQAIQLLRKINDSTNLARVLLNSGEEYYKAKNYNHALKNYEESGKIFKQLKHESGIAYNIGNEGMVYAAQGKDDLAEEKLQDAIQLLEGKQDPYAVSVYLSELASIYAKRNDFKTALGYGQQSLKLAQDNTLKEQIRDANLNLARIYEISDDKATAYDFYKDHIIYRDSIENLENIEKVANLNTAYEVSQKQGELDISNEKRKTQRIISIAAVGIVFMIAMLTLGLYRRNSFIRKTNLILEKEKNRSDHLLRNILPQETAKELKDFGRVKAKKFDSVSVLFADFKGFTLHAEHLSPEDLVKSIDYYFSKFDDIIDKYGIEKIKTLGDCYMCACGLPFPEENHAQKLILAAKEFLDFVRLAKIDNTDNTTRFDLRVGISSGPVVAGVVGKKKFAYDIWGDTVNIASRMEAASEVDKINISEDTYEQVKDDFNCTYRGEIHVKNKGMMKMYFVEGIECNLQDKDIESGLKVHTA